MINNKREKEKTFTHPITLQVWEANVFYKIPSEYNTDYLGFEIFLKPNTLVQYII
jgi:hypothetical protein